MDAHTVCKFGATHPERSLLKGYMSNQGQEVNRWSLVFGDMVYLCGSWASCYIC